MKLEQEVEFKTTEINRLVNSTTISKKIAVRFALKRAHELVELLKTEKKELKRREDDKEN